MRCLVLADLHGRVERLKAIIEEAGPCDVLVFAGDLLRRWDAVQAGLIIDLLGQRAARAAAVAGNIDGPELSDLFAERKISIHGTGALIEGTGFFGAGASNPTPFHSSFEISEEEIARLLERGYDLVREAERKVLVSHTPPIDCRLDRAILGVHAGSTAVRRFLRGHDVDLCICGHIHEAAGEEEVEGVPCVNVGAARDGWYALLDIKQGSITLTRRRTGSRV